MQRGYGEPSPPRIFPALAMGMGVGGVLTAAAVLSVPYLERALPLVLPATAGVVAAISPPDAPATPLPGADRATGAAAMAEAEARAARAALAAAERLAVEQDRLSAMLRAQAETVEAMRGLVELRGAMVADLERLESYRQAAASAAALAAAAAPVGGTVPSPAAQTASATPPPPPPQPRPSTRPSSPPQRATASQPSTRGAAVPPSAAEATTPPQPSLPTSGGARDEPQTAYRPEALPIVARRTQGSPVDLDRCRDVVLRAHRGEALPEGDLAFLGAGCR